MPNTSNNDNENQNSKEQSVLDKLRESEREVRKAIIMQAATTLLTSKPFHEISIRDIAKEAGISVASIYKYFQNQEDLFLEILIVSVRDIVTCIQQEYQNRTVSIRKLSNRFIDDILENETFFRLSCNFLIRGWNNTETMDKFVAFQKQFKAIVKELLKTAGVEDESLIFTRGFIATAFGIVLTIGNDTELSKTEQKEVMHNIVNSLIDRGFTDYLNNGTETS